jgi:hypothetical protein
LYACRNANRQLKLIIPRELLKGEISRIESEPVYRGKLTWRKIFTPPYKKFYAKTVFG